MGLPENIEALMSRHDMSQEALARIAGVSPSSVTKWKSGTEPRREALERIANYFNITVDDLRSDKYGLASSGRNVQITPVPATTSAPVLGSIPAGDALQAFPQSGERMYVDPAVQEKHPNGFYLAVRGDSMNKLLPDGCYAFIDPVAEVDEGDVVAINVNGDDATIKRIRYVDSALVMIPESTNPKHRKVLIDESDPDAPRVRIIGKVVWHVVPWNYQY